MNKKHKFSTRKRKYIFEFYLLTGDPLKALAMRFKTTEMMISNILTSYLQKRSVRNAD